MNILLVSLLFLISLLVIIKGGDWFVDSASWIAKTTGLPDVIIGATIVSIGTTMPELIVSITSAIEGHGDMSIGNAIGSTICNIGLILGICNLISPSKTTSRIFIFKALIMFFYTFTLLFMIIDGEIGKIDTMLLILGLIGYIYINYTEIRNKSKDKKYINTNKYTAVTLKELVLNLIKFFIGIGFIIVGAKLLVENAIIIATFLKVPNVIISLTVIAVGTSLPELVTSVTSLVKGNHNLAIGNVIGSNILNITMVVGISSIFHPLHLSFDTIKLSFIISLLLMFTLIIFSIITKKINRLLATILLTIYASYILLTIIHI